MDIRSMYLDELKELMMVMGEKHFRAYQLFSWLHKRQVPFFTDMKNLPKSLREELGLNWPIERAMLQERLVSKKDGTEKYLFRLNDGNIIESVLMRHDYGNSVCVSSQAGCAMGCRFCASTKKGLARSLSASEMLGQVYAVGREIGERISNIVIMGMGEPLANYDASVRFIRLLSDPEGYGLSQRNITLSTCGLVPEIRRLADEELSVTLAVSLHAATDEQRKKLMPVAKKYSLQELTGAARYYFERTGRRVSFEYALIAGENDSDEDAKNLARLLKGFPTHVNLIPVNTVAESGLLRPGRSEVQEFNKKLEKYGINVTIRKEMGSDINGACGQLRNSYISVGEDSSV